DDRSAVIFGLSGQSVDRLRHVGRSAVVTDIGDVSAALVVDGRLIRAAALQIAIADKPHIFRFRRIAELGRLRGSGERQDYPAGESSCDHPSRVLDQGTSLNRGSS